MRITLLFVLCLLTIQTFSQLSAFTADQVREDLDYLKETMMEAHYDLFAYTTPEAYEATYQELRTSIDSDSLSLLETTNLFQKLVSSVNNGHTEIFFPVQPYLEYAYAGGTVFPLEVAFQNGKPLIRKNWSDNDALIPGSEIIRINGMPIEDILQKLYPHVSAERLYLKHAKMEFYSFPRMYWQVFGEVDAFEVIIGRGERGKQGEQGKPGEEYVETYNLAAIPVMEGYEGRRNEVLHARMELKFMDSNAYLNPGNLSGDKAKFDSFIDSAFTLINTRQAQNLIIDLRSNQGGDNDFGDYIVSYLSDKPFPWCGDYSLRTSRVLKEHTRIKYDTTKAFFRETMERPDGDVFSYDFGNYQPKPTAKRYQGKVYVLVNRHSHSQAAVTAAQMQDLGLATIVGEETGDYPTLMASRFSFILPQTGMSVFISKGLIVRVNGSTAQQGVIPDITIEDFLVDDKDEILNGLLNTLHGENNAGW